MLVAILIGVLALTSGVGQDKPSIQFDSVIGDAGAVLQGDAIRQIFRFANKGGGVLEILNVEHA